MSIPKLLRTAMAGLLCASLLTVALAKDKDKEWKDEPSLENERIVGLMNIAGLNRLGQAGLGGTPSTLGGFVYAFDKNLETRYEAKESGPARIDILFFTPQTLQQVRLLLDQGRYEWSLAAAASVNELDKDGPSVRFLVPARQFTAAGSWDEVKLSETAPARVLRLTLKPLEGKTAVLRECNFLAEQTLEAISVTSSSRVVPLGDFFPLEVTGYYSGGETRLLKGKGLRWTINPPTAARMSTQNRLIGRRKGPLEVSVQYGKFSSPPYPLEVEDPL